MKKFKGLIYHLLLAIFSIMNIKISCKINGITVSKTDVDVGKILNKFTYRK